MAVVTKQELEDASVDAQTLEDVINGAADLNGNGTVTSRLGQTLKTVAKSIQDINTMGVVLDAISAYAAEVGAPASTILIDSSGNVGIRQSDPQTTLHVGPPSTSSTLKWTTSNTGHTNTDGFDINLSSDGDVNLRHRESANMRFYTGGTEAARFDSSQNFLVGKKDPGSGTAGHTFLPSGETRQTVDGGVCAVYNRKVNDGDVVLIQQGNLSEGSISVSGTTVSYNGGHLARWARFTDDSKPEMLKGTILSNLDSMVEWHHEAEPATYWAAGDGLPEGVNVGDVKTEAVDTELDEEGNEITAGVPATYWSETDGFPEGVSIGDEKTPAKEAWTEDNEQLNHIEISSVEGDKNVTGVFVSWDNDDDEYNDMNIAMKGDMVIRVNAGETVQRGDLLISAGNGCAKVQADDIYRSSTVAKVNSTHKSFEYPDGSYCVPCTLMM